MVQPSAYMFPGNVPQNLAHLSRPFVICSYSQSKLSLANHDPIFPTQDNLVIVVIIFIVVIVAWGAPRNPYAQAPRS